jgi:hypothetical protein
MTTIVHSDRDSSKVVPFSGAVAGHPGAHATSHAERELRHKLDKAKRDYDARLLVVEALLTSADLGINRRTSRALERAMGELVQANTRHVRALAALGDFLIDGTHS